MIGDDPLAAFDGIYGEPTRSPGSPPHGYVPPPQPRPDGSVAPEPSRALTQGVHDRYLEPIPEPYPHKQCRAYPGKTPKKLLCELTHGHSGYHYARNRDGQWHMYDALADTPYYARLPTCPNSDCLATANLNHVLDCPFSDLHPLDI